MLKNARNIDGIYKQGDVVMYRVHHQGARAPGDEWAGPARIIGFDNEVVWVQAGGHPVATALHLLRPASTPELLAWQVRGRNMRPIVVPQIDSAPDQRIHRGPRPTTTRRRSCSTGRRR